MTRAQRRAAIQNAQHSTGPRTPEGKAASSRNAVKHNLSGTTFVLLPGENSAAFDALVHDYTVEWNPRTPHETFLVTQMVQARWRLNRIARMEAEVYNAIFTMPFAEGQSDEGAIVIAHPLMNDGMLDKLHRYAKDAERSYNRAVKELRAYRAEHRKTAPESTHCEKIQNEPKLPATASATAQAGAPFSLPDSGSPLLTPPFNAQPAPCSALNA